MEEGKFLVRTEGENKIVIHKIDGESWDNILHLIIRSGALNQIPDKYKKYPLTEDELYKPE